MYSKTIETGIVIEEIRVIRIDANGHLSLLQASACDRIADVRRVLEIVADLLLSLLKFLCSSMVFYMYM